MASRIKLIMLDRIGKVHCLRFIAIRNSETPFSIKCGLGVEPGWIIPILLFSEKEIVTMVAASTQTD